MSVSGISSLPPVSPVSQIQGPHQAAASDPDGDGDNDAKVSAASEARG